MQEKHSYTENKKINLGKILHKNNKNLSPGFEKMLQQPKPKEDTDKEAEATVLNEMISSVVLLLWGLTV